jgi:hypothetical protein
MSVHCPRCNTLLAYCERGLALVVRCVACDAWVDWTGATVTKATSAEDTHERCQSPNRIRGVPGWKTQCTNEETPMPDDLIKRSETYTAINTLIDGTRHDRRQFLIDGRQIEAAACDIRIAALRAALDAVEKLTRRG